MKIADEIERCVCVLREVQTYEFDAFSLQYCIDRCCGEFKGLNYEYLEYSGSCEIVDSFLGSRLEQSMNTQVFLSGSLTSPLI